MLEPIDIHAPQFTASDAADIAEMDPGLLKLWIRRGLIEPARIEQLTVRRRPHFSVVTIFKAELMILIGKSLSVSPLWAKKLANRVELEAQKNITVLSGSAGTKVLDGGWMSAVARSTEKDEPLDIIGAATLLNDYWDLRLFLADENFVPRFKTDVHWVVLPLSKIFASVYRKCRDLLLYDTLRQTRKMRRARS